MLHRAGNTARHIQLGRYGNAGLADLFFFGLQPQVNGRAGSAHRAAQFGGQLLQHVKTGFVFHTAPAGDDHFGLVQLVLRGGFVKVFADDAHAARFGRHGNGFIDDLRHAARARNHFLKHIGAHGGHLRAVIRAFDIGHNVAAESRTGLYQKSVGNGQARAVRRQPHKEFRRNTRGQVAPDISGRIQHHAGVILFNQGHHGIGVSGGVVIAVRGAADGVNFVRAVRGQLRKIFFHPVADNHGAEFLTQLVGQFAAFGQQFKAHGADLLGFAVIGNFNKGPHAFIGGEVFFGLRRARGGQGQSLDRADGHARAAHGAAAVGHRFAVNQGERPKRAGGHAFAATYAIRSYLNHLTKLSFCKISTNLAAISSAEPLIISPLALAAGGKMRDTRVGEPSSPSLCTSAPIWAAVQI